MQINKFAILVSGLFALCVVPSVSAEMFEYPSAKSLPYDDATKFPLDPALLSGNDVNLSAERFANSWFSKTNERERIKANMYLLGVLDATEGTAWCEYKKVLPHTIYEMLYSNFKDLTTEQKNQRASTLIVNEMSKILPCKNITKNEGL